MEKLAETRLETATIRRVRRPVSRRVAAAERQMRPQARRNTDMASRVATTRMSRPAAETGEERLATLGLRASITAAMVGMSLFFHAQLGAVLISLLPGQ